MDIARAEYETLLLACEDWTGLWEPLWVLNTIAPDVPIKERERLAAAAIRNLRDAGYITFVRMAWPPAGEPEKVAPEEVETALRGDGWRQIPPIATFGSALPRRARLLFPVRSGLGTA